MRKAADDKQDGKLVATLITFKLYIWTWLHADTPVMRHALIEVTLIPFVRHPPACCQLSPEPLFRCPF